MNTENYIKTTAFRLFGFDNFQVYQYVIPFTTAPVNGITYFFPYDAFVNNNAITGIQIVSAGTNDLNKINLNGLDYNLLTDAQLADYLGYFKFNENYVFEGLPFNILASCTNGRKGNVLAVKNARIDTEKTSYFIKQGATPQPATPFAIVFNFYFKNG